MEAGRLHPRSLACARGDWLDQHQCSSGRAARQIEPGKIDLEERLGCAENYRNELVRDKVPSDPDLFHYNRGERKLVRRLWDNFSFERARKRDGGY